MDISFAVKLHVCKEYLCGYEIILSPKIKLIKDIIVHRFILIGVFVLCAGRPAPRAAPRRSPAPAPGKINITIYEF